MALPTVRIIKSFPPFAEDQRRSRNVLICDQCKYNKGRRSVSTAALLEVEYKYCILKAISLPVPRPCAPAFCRRIPDAGSAIQKSATVFAGAAFFEFLR